MYRIPINSRVKLRDGIDPALYKGFSCTGNEGWIRNHRQDNLGFPQVLIEWDRDHWAYNGAPNCWTWEDHFDLIEGDMTEPENQPQDKSQNDAIRALTEEFLKGLFSVLGATDQEIEQADAEATITHTADDPTEEAISTLRDSKAFILIAMSEEKEGIIVPAIYQRADSNELALVCQAQLGHLLTLLQDSLIHQTLKGIKE